MHQALLIDEILRRIFGYAAESKRDLATFARVCKSWKCPALDFVWERLPSMLPLLHLIENSGKEDVSPCYNSITLSSYAAKVRHLSHRQSTGLDPATSSFLSSHYNPHKPLLPSLADLKLSVRTWSPLHFALSFSPHIQRLDLDLGFGSQAIKNADATHQFLVQILLSARDLYEVHIRGTASQRLQELTPYMFGIHKLSLWTGTSLTPSALSSLAQLPSLVDFAFHAEHLSAQDLSSVLAGDCFPSLSKLRVRAQSATFEVLLSVLQRDKLNWLWLEAQDASHTAIAWDDITEIIVTKASHSLQFLCLEHHVEFMQDELQVNTPTSSVASTQLPTTPPLSAVPNVARVPLPSLSLNTFKELRTLQELRIEMTIPPDYDEQDLKNLNQGCPNLTVLDLGGTSCIENGIMPSLREQTFRCFQQFRNLKELVLPSLYRMDQITQIPGDAPKPQHTLRSLTFGRVSTEDCTALSRHLSSVFPCLERLDGAPAQDSLWASARAELLRLQAR
ncbi:hypothetical protein P691DRAFT_656514 [Macrolepiota fuliginosa MF-IS2]|uniref:F-box domain-containing protein n=1 Tax=Macrolepiota fuliginosa MF-IS2 TaxID=1400762 RepID=A0A9P5XP05_9AGAR|nr:hypothetical protein P691DRAFT_656514 [Macrolepiota fuliginosa MF-IS2]